MVDSVFFTDTVTVLRLSTTTRGNGGEIVKTFTTLVDLSASFQNLKGNWIEVNGVAKYNIVPMCFTEWSTVVRKDDRIRFENVDYEILNVGKGFGDHLEIALQYRST